MTVFRKSVSWSKFKLGRDCPLRLQFTLEKIPSFRTYPNQAATRGKATQKVMELYFNHDLNLKPGGRDPAVLSRIWAKLWAAKWHEKEKLHLPHNVTEEEFYQEVEATLPKALETCRRAGMLDYEVRSEVNIKGQYQGFKMFGKVDFRVHAKGGVFLFDGKGHTNPKDAEKDQLLYYALIEVANNQRVMGGGFLFWEHGYEPINLTPQALKFFADTELAKVRPVFDELARGTSVLPAKPSNATCFFCQWKHTCNHSPFRQKESPIGLNEVSFGDPRLDPAVRKPPREHPEAQTEGSGSASPTGGEDKEEG